MENITINGEVFTYCDGKFTDTGEHAPIYLHGHFRALCPLCAARAAAEEAEADRVHMEEDSDDARREAENARDAMADDRDALRDVIDEAAELVEMALAAEEDAEGERAAREALKILKANGSGKGEE